jgi:hypothetical protein
MSVFQEHAVVPLSADVFPIIILTVSTISKAQPWSAGMGSSVYVYLAFLFQTPVTIPLLRALAAVCPDKAITKVRVHSPCHPLGVTQTTSFDAVRGISPSAPWAAT